MSLLEAHLKFFDPRNTGRISWRDNYAGWRALGFGRLKSLVQTLGSALLFGWRQGGVIDIRRIGQHRPAGATGIYGPDGNLDDTVWARYRAAFLSAAPEGSLSVEETRGIFSRLGRIPARQFESLYAVCARMNGAPTVTLEQLEWLYDGSLLYRAAERIKAGE